ncbi:MULTISPECIES: hypothetical protein [Acinetobacter]|uniref:Lipoprotein n=5 Tax=Acinetobacter calcoaceticus/baumannii complex TaxID=909768 RepID=A0A5E9PC75_9GAMM|nr:MULTISPECIES: hypothetical protein [Acinetobacter]AVI33653.1 hypothetical protein CSB70_0864 [Acinetobacter baumannii]AVI35877.1 hypothetical protein CSB68_2361 [Acinetobacter baumannii]EHU1237250.1 hypothetical protein [Acinetobacter baumannii]EHU1448741.1 hypothetical protein [Acinetobacter baumannii]EHU1568114.1 hypothetical protein [Acinetobacter baumannii]
MKKILYYIFLSILIISCTSFNEENDVHEKVDLKKLSNELFSTYKYEVDTDRNKSSTQLIVIKINKENFSINDYNDVKNKLLSRKWDFVDSYDNYYNFCKTNNYSIDILNPIHDRHYTRDGDEVNFKSKDYWYFALYFNKLGVNNCMEYYGK